MFFYNGHHSHGGNSQCVDKARTHNTPRIKVLSSLQCHAMPGLWTLAKHYWLSWSEMVRPDKVEEVFPYSKQSPISRRATTWKIGRIIKAQITITNSRARRIDYLPVPSKSASVTELIPSDSLLNTLSLSPKNRFKRFDRKPTESEK
ncbi:hypothetical protein RRG08_052393 [Elysia crispata]|uniref:Uncharacterized protein n=1 Tax=Elysia crispata TaxID=231223 RepID=A0AAE1E8F0_9GAST|nr:hypothetical protein RRG08_052393 [Elysia crispata]